MAAPIKNILYFIGADLLMRPAAVNLQVFMDRKYVRVMFRIRLHVDDVAILYRIKECAYKGKNILWGSARRGGGKVVIEKDAARTRALYLLLLMLEILLMYYFQF